MTSEERDEVKQVVQEVLQEEGVAIDDNTIFPMKNSAGQSDALLMMQLDQQHQATDYSRINAENLTGGGGGSITIDPVPTEDSSNAVASGGVYDALEEKQEKLASGLNIKTINGQSIVGEGNLVTESDTVPFDGFILLSPITIIDGSVVDPDAILYYRDVNRFVAKKGNKYYNNWVDRLLYNNGNAPYTSKLYPYDGAVYTWDGTTFAATGGTSVRYDAQTLTTQQKAQARSNIATIGYEAQTLTTQQKEQAAQNIGLGVVVKGDVQQSLSDAQKVQAQNNMMGKAYAPAQNSGLGKVYLDKNNGVLTQSMMQATNTVYVIQYDYTMSGNITVPAGCTLEFDGGSISGSYQITGNNTNIVANPSAVIFDGIDIQGTWVVKNIYATWMKIANANSCYNEIASICRLQNDNVDQHLYLPAFDIKITPPANNSYPCIASNNIHISIPNKIEYNANNKQCCGMIYIADKRNVTIDGGGTLSGDLGNHDYSTNPAKYNADGIRCISGKQITIKNLTILKFEEDGIYLGGGSETAFGLYTNACEDVTIDNVISNYNGRQGMSVIHARGLKVSNSKFQYTGTIVQNDPSAGVDFEPNTATQGIEDVTFDNCDFNYNYGNGLEFVFANDSVAASSVYKNFRFSNCQICNEQGNEYVEHDSKNYLLVDSKGIKIKAVAKPVNFLFDNCDIHFIRFESFTAEEGDIHFSNSRIYGFDQYEYVNNRIDGKKLYFEKCTLASGQSVMRDAESASSVHFNPFFLRTKMEMSFSNCTFDYYDYYERTNFHVGNECNIISAYKGCLLRLNRLPGFANEMSDCTLQKFAIDFQPIKGKTIRICGNVSEDYIAGNVADTIDYYGVGSTADETKVVFIGNRYNGLEHTSYYIEGYLFRAYNFSTVFDCQVVYEDNKAVFANISKTFGDYILNNFTNSKLSRLEPFVDGNSLVYRAGDTWVN